MQPRRLQGELDTLDPNDLRALFTDAIAPFPAMSAIREARAVEEADREQTRLLAELADRFSPPELRCFLRD